MPLVSTSFMLMIARFAEIIAGIHEEERVSEGFTWKEALLPANRFRFIIVVTLQMGSSFALA
jgi:hypothetical protein